MALSDKNIIITPNIGSASDPKIQFSGADASTGAQTITLNVYPTSGGMLSFEGSSGQLFSIANSLTGTIYSVNDISGIPSIEVLDSGLVKLAQYNGTVVIGGSTTDGTAKLQVSGGPSRFGNIYVGYGTYKNSIRPVDDSNMNLDTPDGYTGSGTSLRAPIFYDVDNTGFYINPASSSNLNTVYANFFCGNSGNAYGQYKGYDNNNHFIAIRGVVGGTTSSPSITGGHNTTLVEYAEANDSTGWFFKTAATGNYDIVSRITRSYSYFESSARSPIFYDSDNTGYYLDPTSSTSLRTVGDWRSDSTGWTGEYNGKIQYHSNNWYFQAASDWIWRNSGGTNVVYANQSGDLQAVGSMRSPIFYDQNDTGYYIDPNSTGAAALRMRGGALFGPNPTWGRYLYIGGNGDYDSAEAQIFTTNGNLHLEPKAGNAIYLDNYRGGWFRANGWYDNNDTGYYVDPNGTSRMARVDFSNLYYAGDNSYGFLGSSIYVDTINSGYNGDQLEFNYVRGTWAGISHDSLRAPIFYDYNDTSYYIDANNTSVLYQLNMWGRIAVDNALDYSSTAVTGLTSAPLTAYAIYDPSVGTTNTFLPMTHQTAQYSSGYRTHLNTGLYKLASGWGYNSTGWYAALGGTDANPTMHWRLTYGVEILNSEGYVAQPNSFRAPIFYDYNDTNYYVDPGSTSRMNRIDPNEIYNHGWFRNHSNNYGLYNQANGTHFYSNGAASWAITGSGGTVELQFRSNHQSTMRGYVFGDTSGNFGLLDSNGSWKVRIDTSNIEHYGTTWTTTQYGYIWYDRSDSGYYSDPNGTSRLDWVNANGLRSYSNVYIDGDYGRGVVGVYSASRLQGVFAMGDSYKLASDGTSAGSLYGLAWSHPNAGGVASNLNTHGLLVMENGGFLAAVSGSIRARDNMHAPIYYDRDDTGYYCDPASSSRFNQTRAYYYNVYAGNGHGIRFWESDAYKISMGDSSLYIYGPVTGHSIKTNMDNGSTGRGFTWGREGYAPIAAIESTYGNMQIAGSFTAGGNVTAYSDISLKENIENIADAVNKVMKIRGVTFTRNDLDDKTKRYAGVIAQEIEVVLPEVVEEDISGIKHVAYGNMVGLLIEAIKEQQAEITELKSLVKQLLAN
jgi:hypothetical protein